MSRRADSYKSAIGAWLPSADNWQNPVQRVQLELVLADARLPTNTLRTHRPIECQLSGMRCHRRAGLEMPVERYAAEPDGPASHQPPAVRCSGVTAGRSTHTGVSTETVSTYCR